MAALLALGQAAPPAQIPFEDFLRTPEYAQVALPPSGERLAAIVNREGHRNIAIVDLEKREARLITRYTDIDVLAFQWVNEHRLVFMLGEDIDPLDPPRYRGLYALDADGTNLWAMHQLLFARMLEANVDGNDIVVAMPRRMTAGTDVYRFDTSRRERTILSEGAPDSVWQWVLDDDHRPRFAYSSYGNDSDLWAKEADGHWESLWHSAAPTVFFSLLGSNREGTEVYIATRNGEDRIAIWKFDRASRKFTGKLFGDDLVDVTGGLIWHGGEVAGIAYQSAEPVHHWLDSHWERLQRGVDAALPGRANTIHPGARGAKRHLVYSYSSDTPGAWYLLDAEHGKLEPLRNTRAWLEKAIRWKRTYAAYKARDGRLIPAYLTVPADRPPQALPLVVNIHGGPWMRGYQWSQWGGDITSYLLASRGYAVLEPEPRGSAGFGIAHRRAGYKQWGLAMQDDITDGVRDLIARGVVDSRRVCLMGGSYGGYATLQGLVREPEAFRCGIAYLAVSDLGLMQWGSWSDISNDFLDGNFKRWVGDSDADREQFQATSPARNAARFQAPVMLAYGTADRRVPLVQGERMREALERAGKPYEWVQYDGERHGWLDPRNRLDFYRRVEKFLADSLR